MKIHDIQIKAEKLAHEYNPQGIAPFPFEKFPEHLHDLNIYANDKLPPEVSGVILFHKGEFDILINQDRPQVTKNFTLARKLGHYFLHKNIVRQEGLIIDQDDTAGNQQPFIHLDRIKAGQIDIEASNFAFSLLMPAHLVHRAWQAFHSIQNCARAFQVSVSVMSIRLEKLNLISLE